MKNALRVTALSLIVIATLAGCFKVKMDVTLNSDDTVSGSMIVAIQSGIGESLGQSDESILDELTTDVGDDLGDATVEDYTEEGYIGKVYAFKGLPLDEFSAGGTSEDLSITREGNLFIVDGTVNSEDISGGGEMDPGMLGGEFTFSVTFPGEVTESNGTVEGNTVTWNLLEADSIHAEGKASASSDIWIWVVIGLVILLIAAGVVFTAIKVRGRNAEVAAAPATFDAPPVEPAPTEPMLPEPVDPQAEEPPAAEPKP